MQQDQSEEPSPPTQNKQHSQSQELPQAQSEPPVIHQQIGHYADPSLINEQEVAEGIQISIDSHESRGSLLMKYTVYHIKGEDKNGSIDVYRRYNEFYKMRVALVKRYPGCFIPSIPDKAISIVDDEITNKRQRFLNDFVRKMTRLPHLYQSEEFQALIRSPEKDLSSSFEKWPNPTTTDIINKYKETFSDLAGRVINNEVRASIHEFSKLIAMTEGSLVKFKMEVKTLATMRDRLDRHLIHFFKHSLPAFEESVLTMCTDKEEELISIQPNEAKFQQHGRVVQQALKRNPYWLLYDVIKHEDRDGKAFLECVKAIEDYENKKCELDIKMTENARQLNDFTIGKKTNPEQKYKLEVEVQNLKREKESLQCLTDIIIALVAYVEMDKFRVEKSRFYENFLKKLGGYEINLVQNMHEVWQDWNRKTEQLLERLW